MIFTETVVNQIWDILAEECGATKSRLVWFKAALLGEPVRLPFEFTFGGTRGTKFYADQFGWRVGCYREEATSDVVAAMDKADVRLAELFKAVGS